MNIIIDNFGVYINQIRLTGEISRTEEIIAILGTENRIIDLDQDTKLIIYDKLGIRFWTSKELLVEFQIVFNTIGKEVFPDENFSGGAKIKNKFLSIASKKEDIERDFETEVDDDSKHYRVNVLFILDGDLRICSVRFDDNNCVIYISK